MLGFVLCLIVGLKASIFRIKTLNMWTGVSILLTADFRMSFSFCRKHAFKQKWDILIFLGIRNVCSVSNHKFSFARWWWIMPGEDGRFCITLKMQLSSYLKLWIHRLWGRWISFYLIPRKITISRRQKMESIAWNSRIFLSSPQISQKGKKTRVFEALGNETEARLYTLQQLDSWCS